MTLTTTVQTHPPTPPLTTTWPPRDHSATYKEQESKRWEGWYLQWKSKRTVLYHFFKLKCCCSNESRALRIQPLEWTLLICQDLCGQGKQPAVTDGFTPPPSDSRGQSFSGEPRAILVNAESQSLQAVVCRNETTWMTVCPTQQGSWGEHLWNVCYL